jgi:hypothetical protein
VRMGLFEICSKHATLDYFATHCDYKQILNMVNSFFHLKYIISKLNYDLSYLSQRQNTTIYFLW